jgi:Protein of unknown function (DUF5132)
MALIEDMFKGGNVASGLAIGVGLYVLAPALMPVLRPIAKSIVKAGLVAYDEGRVAFAELSERTEDMVAEVRAEMPAESTEGARRTRRQEKPATPS